MMITLVMMVMTSKHMYKSTSSQYDDHCHGDDDDILDFFQKNIFLDEGFPWG